MSTRLWVCFGTLKSLLSVVDLEMIRHASMTLKQLMIYSSDVILYNFNLDMYRCGYLLLFFEMLSHITVVCSIECGRDILSCGIWWAWFFMNIFGWCECLGKWMWVWLFEHENFLSVVELETFPDAPVTFIWIVLFTNVLEKCIDVFCRCYCPAIGRWEPSTLLNLINAYNEWA